MWHGQWSTHGQNIVAYFDFEGKRNWNYKWVEVDAQTGLGRDYIMRPIHIRHLQTWYFDQRVASFLDNPQ